MKNGIILLIASLLLSCAADPYEKRQVKRVAPTEPGNPILQVKEHISLTLRPKETYHFPVPLGEVGPVDSLYSGNRQYPFYCMTLDGNLEQPMVDNQQGYGVPVYNQNEEVIGYSKDCLIPARLDYFYATAKDKKVKSYDPNQPPSPGEIATTLIKGKEIPQIYRVERGSINRYIYHVIMLDPEGDLSNRNNKDYWNGKLIYQFKGGSSIGFLQGRQNVESMMEKRLTQLSQGYAIVSSTGNKTSYGYNMLMAEDNARRVKSHFISLYGDPLYTVGIGGSGGGLAQYLIAQNSTGIIDGLMPLYGYPDMISQSIFLLDCDLLQHYYNIYDRHNEKWLDWEQRQKIEGMNAINDYPQKFGFLQPINQLVAGTWPSIPKGNSECIRSWIAAATFFNNPKQGFLKPYFSDEVVDQVNWTYWQDLEQIFGVDENGFARTTWGNQGVQYGLLALRQRDISIDEFIHLNHHIGSWVEQDKMKKESSIAPFGKQKPLWISLWSRNNITKPNPHMAKRKPSDPKAIDKAYRYGQVFIGKVDLPILDIRHYLEETLNMHHVSASFETRLRLREFQGHSDNQVIWISHQDHTPVDEGMAIMDKWLMALHNDPNKTVLETKPVELQDTCMDSEGLVIGKGEHVWDGAWNNKADGACNTVFPIYSNSRIQAGGPWSGSVFKCGLIPVSEAIQRNFYGDINMKPHQKRLEGIFPDGVCDYLLGDVGRPYMSF